MNKRIVVVLLVLTLALPTIAVAQNATQTQAQTETSGSSEYTLDELTRLGSQPSNAPPSVRVSGREAFWVRDYPAQPWVNADPSDQSETSWEFLEYGDTVRRNTLYLRSVRPDMSERIETLVIAYYDVGTRKVQTGNGTTTKQVAKNVTVQKVNVQLGNWFDWNEIPLKAHPDEPTKAVMWFQSDPSIRWSFTHHSAATTEAVNMEDKGDLLWWASKFILLPSLIGSIGMTWASRKALRKAAAGPMLGPATWAIILGIGAFIIVMYFWNGLASIFSAGPWVMSFLIVGVVTIQVLESYDENSFKALFFQPKISETVDFRDALDRKDGESIDYTSQLDYAETSEKRLVQHDGELFVVSRGIRPFLARVLGSRCKLDMTDLKTRIKLPNSDFREMVVVDPESEYDVIKHEPETMELQMPELSRDEAGKFAVSAVVGVIAGSASYSVITFNPIMSGVVGLVAGTAALLLLSLTPTGGEADADAAPIHFRDVMATSILESEGLSDARTVEDMGKELAKAKAEGGQERVEYRDQRDETIVSEMLEDMGVDKPDKLLENGREESADETEVVDDEE